MEIIERLSRALKLPAQTGNPPESRRSAVNDSANHVQERIDNELISLDDYHASSQHTDAKHLNRMRDRIENRRDLAPMADDNAGNHDDSSRQQKPRVSRSSQPHSDSESYHGYA